MLVNVLSLINWNNLLCKRLPFPVKFVIPIKMASALLKFFISSFLNNAK